jgi:hypothetical protein
MQFVIDTITTPAQNALAASVRRQVFDNEFRMKVPELEPADGTRVLDLLATVKSTREPVATLTVLDTSGHDDLHARYGLPFKSGARAARYTRLAVMKHYRRMNLPLALMCEANHRFVSVSRIDHIWLLLDPKIAKSSVFCTLLAFAPHAEVVMPGYGPRVVLIRNEFSHRALASDAASQGPSDEILLSAGPLLGSVASYSQAAAL